MEQVLAKLDQIVQRLDRLESKVGGGSAGGASHAPAAASGASGAEGANRVAAFFLLAAALRLPRSVVAALLRARTRSCNGNDRSWMHVCLAEPSSCIGCTACREFVDMVLRPLTRAGAMADALHHSATAVAAFQALVDQHLANFAELSNKIGGDVAGLAPLVAECMAQSKALIAEASRSKARARTKRGGFVLKHL